MSRRSVFWSDKNDHRNVTCVPIDINVADYKEMHVKITTKKKPTYSNIKSWIREEYGLSVSTLYIAEMKERLGIGKQYRYEGTRMAARRPGCPREKALAIEEAFKKSGLI